jgi:hypothetical protein
MTFTVHIEVIGNFPSTCLRGFYNPAVAWAAKYPRTTDGITKALLTMQRTAKKQDWILDFRFKLYEGRVYHYTKNPELIGVFNSELDPT